MRYRLFLYKPNTSEGLAAVGGIINAVTAEDLEIGKLSDSACDFMRSFDADEVIDNIEAKLTDSPTHVCKCRTKIRYISRQDEKINYIYVVTSYDRASQVIPTLHAVAAEYELTLFDAETKRILITDITDDAYITMKIRRQELHNAISNSMKPIRNIRRIEFASGKIEKSRSYVVTICKDAAVSFLERTARFHDCLYNNLCEGEELICENRYYTVKGRGYILNYILEGYKKHADTIGFTENGINCTELLNRMGTEEAYRWLGTCTGEERNDIFNRMSFREMKAAYPNPAQRLNESIKITKWQRKQVFNIQYRGLGCYGSGVSFHAVPDENTDNTDGISVLRIGEEGATFILPFINDIYPGFYKKHLSEKYIVFDILKRILIRLKDAGEMILNDTFNHGLSPYIRRFNLNIFTAESNIEKCPKSKKHKAEVVYENRYEIMYLYDIFIRWSEAQLKYYDDGMLTFENGTRHK